MAWAKSFVNLSLEDLNNVLLSELAEEGVGFNMFPSSSSKDCVSLSALEITYAPFKYASQLSMSWQNI